MSIDFPLVKVATGLGTLWDPCVDVAIRAKTGWLRFRFLLDTGADCSMAPRSAATALGLDLSSRPVVATKGIEGAGVPSRKARVKARIGGVGSGLTLLFTESDETPFLLGRLDVFDRFSLEIDNRARVLRLVTLRRRR